MKKILATYVLAVAFCFSAEAQKPATYALWSGCFERVVVVDGTRPRIFERRESRESTRAGKPGTGEWGEWRECAPHKPGVTSFGYDHRVWPRAIEQKEVERLFGPSAWRWFDRRRQARVSEWYNLTGDKRWGTWF